MVVVAQHTIPSKLSHEGGQEPAGIQLTELVLLIFRSGLMTQWFGVPKSPSTEETGPHAAPTPVSHICLPAQNMLQKEEPRAPVTVRT